MNREYISIRRVKCAGCGNYRSYNPALKIKYDPTANYKLLLACSVECASKFCEPVNVIDKPEVLMTRNGPIPYRLITKTQDSPNEKAKATKATV